MKVLSACSALLSDYEALSVLRDLESQQIKEFRHAQPSKTGVTLHQGPLDPSEEETYLLSIPSNLKDVQLEVRSIPIFLSFPLLFFVRGGRGGLG